MSAHNDRSKLIPFYLFGGFTCVYLFCASIDAPNIGDARAMLEVSKTIVQNGFQNNPGQSRSESFSRAGLGQSLLNLPVTWAYIEAVKADNISRLYYSLFLSLLSAIIGAAANLLLYLCARRLGYSLVTCVTLSLINGFTTMTWVYSQALLADPTITFMWLLALYNLLTYKENSRPFNLVIAGFAIGFAILTKIFAAFALPLFIVFVYYLIQRVKANDSATSNSNIAGVSRHWAYFACPVVVMLGTVVWYNYFRYGGIFQTGYTAGRDQIFGFNTPILVGVYGLLFSSGKSFFLYNLSTILGVFSISRFYNRFRSEALLISGLILGIVVIHAKWWAWSGDWAWGPRFLAAVPPLLLLVSAELFEGRFSSGLRRKESFPRKIAVLMIVLTLCASFAVQILGISVSASSYIMFATNETEVLEEGFYHPEKWPIRDDNVTLHFIPEFSPITGHFWMLRCILNPTNGDLRRSPPWKGLNPKWVSDDPHESYFQHNIWWLYTWSKTPNSMSLTVFAGSLIISGLIMLFMAVRLSRRFTKKSC